MTIPHIFLALSFAGTLAAQTFIQMSDPQFGMYTQNANFQLETANFDFAIASANRLKPAFIIINGDLINEGANAAQAAEYKRISAKLDPRVSLRSRHRRISRLPNPSQLHMRQARARAA